MLLKRAEQTTSLQTLSKWTNQQLTPLHFECLGSYLSKITTSVLMEISFKILMKITDE